MNDSKHEFFSHVMLTASRRSEIDCSTRNTGNDSFNSIKRGVILYNKIIYHLIDPMKLIPTEEIDQDRSDNLKDDILAKGIWTSPIIIHERDLFVMDGHHRLDVAKKLDLNFVPVLLSDYDRIDVTAWREGESVTPEVIFAMARSGRKFPYKTTRHTLRGALPRCNMPLGELMQTGIELSSSPPTPDAIAMLAGFA